MHENRRRGRRFAAAVWVRRWLIALNSTAFLAALLLAFVTTRRALILAALVPAALAPFSYARLRLQRAVESWVSRPYAVLAFAVCGVFLDVFMFVQLLAARSPSQSTLNAAILSWIGPVWFSAHALLFAGYALIGAVRLLSRPLGRAAQRLASVRRQRGDGPTSPARREFLQQIGMAGAGIPFVLSVSSIPLSYDFRVEEREIELPYWPPALDGLRIAHLSDIHVGGQMNRRRVLRVAELTRRQSPDLVVHTGDFLTHRGKGFDEPLYEALGSITAPHGQWACLGNHDFDDADLLVRRLAECGVTTLRDRMVTIRVAGYPVELAGLDYRFRLNRRAERYAAIVGTWGGRVGTPRLLLNHDPTAFAELPENCADLVLSGHTHGGQIGIQLDSARALTVVGLAGIPDQGIFRRGDMRLYVTRCVGFYGYPMRIGIPPEIAILTLRAPKRSGTTRS